MLQELLGGGSSLIAERKVSIPSPLAISTPPSPPPSSTTPVASSENHNQNQNQKLRCPRCDSSNTKFCYYNNYNLTQPRHFCKTCRRYWTKGGALRNVPIGGGCRKSKNVTATSPVLRSMTKSSTGAASLKTNLSHEIVKLGFEGYEHQLHPPIPIVWAPSPQSTSHLLALLRSSQNPNPNTKSVGAPVKEETVQTLGLGTTQFNSFWRSNIQSQAEQTGFGLHHDQAQNNSRGINRDLYQRLGLTADYYPDQHSTVLMSSDMATSSAPSATVLESAPAAAAVSGELGQWNLTVPWSDLPTTNRAYP